MKFLSKKEQKGWGGKCRFWSASQLFAVVMLCNKQPRNVVTYFLLTDLWVNCASAEPARLSKTWVSLALGPRLQKQHFSLGQLFSWQMAGEAKPHHTNTHEASARNIAYLVAVHNPLANASHIAKPKVSGMGKWSLAIERH